MDRRADICPPRLFIDVDDTLIKWGPEEGWATKWEVNYAVLFYARAWKEANQDGEIIVWSLGGKEYAESWRNRFFPTEKAMAKYPRIPQSADLFIDDSPLLEYASRSIHPFELGEMI